ncbi:phage tail tube protein [Dyadobacter sp. CY351]|uniref:phage tail tube protein n=1 Tax=Dyadobacter sp. CY351 TaxID=2909337 RepID=UPI001F1DCBAB|nr:phage tail tube protein [Dyadobacter sp. CY351]MCF2517126.1 phage tail protein [Dyadobacter sp. CY351]
MAKFNGSLLKMFVAGAPDKEIKDTRDISITVNTAEIDVTTRDSGGWKEYLGGVRSWTGKATGIVDWATTSGKVSFGELIAYDIARAPVAIEFSTLATGDVSYAGNGYFTNVTFSAPHEGEVTWNADVIGTGALVPAAIA